jgi:hypothetical protein
MKIFLLIVMVFSLSSCDNQESFPQIVPGMIYMGMSKDQKISLYKFEDSDDPNNINECFIVRENWHNVISISCVPRAQTK